MLDLSKIQPNEEKKPLVQEVNDLLYRAKKEETEFLSRHAHAVEEAELALSEARSMDIKTQLENLADENSEKIADIMTQAAKDLDE
jgi:hypothetical protein